MEAQLQKLGLLAALLPLVAIARAAEYDAKPPPTVTHAMLPGAISVAYETLKIGPQGSPAAVHISVVPKGGSPIGAKTPKTHEELFASQQGISLGLPIVPSPFYLDVFAPATNQPNAPLQRVNSVRFTDDRKVNSIVLSYLKPKQKQGPMLLVGYSTFRSFSLRVFTFPDGLRGRVVVSEFLQSFGGTNYGTRFDISPPDAHGNVALVESGYSPTGTDWSSRYVWNGQRFAQQPKVITPKPYLVIAAMSHRRAALETLLHQLGDNADAIGTGEVLPTSDFPRLPSGSYILVLTRCPTVKSAAERVAFWQQADYLRTANPAAQRLHLWVQRGS